MEDEQDRILRVADMVQFKRVSPNDMRKIAYRIGWRRGQN